jgi:hypothetical protein
MILTFFKKEIEHLDPGLGVKWNSKTLFIFDPFSECLTSKFTKNASEKEQKIINFFFRLSRSSVASAHACRKAGSEFKRRPGTQCCERGFGSALI